MHDRLRLRSRRFQTAELRPWLHRSLLSCRMRGHCFKNLPQSLLRSIRPHKRAESPCLATKVLQLFQLRCNLILSLCRLHNHRHRRFQLLLASRIHRSFRPSLSWRRRGRCFPSSLRFLAQCRLEFPAAIHLPRRSIRMHRKSPGPSRTSLISVHRLLMIQRSDLAHSMRQMWFLW